MSSSLMLGAHYSLSLSNTYMFYKRGWLGINIGAGPGSMLLFDWRNSRNINIQ
jgi:hypothetical protein